MSKLRERVLAELFAQRDGEIAKLRDALAAMTEQAERARGWAAQWHAQARGYRLRLGQAKATAAALTDLAADGAAYKQQADAAVENCKAALTRARQAEAELDAAQQGLASAERARVSASDSLDEVRGYLNELYGLGFRLADILLHDKVEQVGDESDPLEKIAAQVVRKLRAAEARAMQAEQERDKLLTVEGDALRETYWIREGYDRGRRDTEEKLSHEVRSCPNGQSDPRDARIRELETYVQCLTKELGEENALRERLTQLLTHTAGGLKGRPAPLHLHDWSDLPQVAAALRRERDALKCASIESTPPPSRCRECGRLLVEQVATHCWPRCQE